MPNLLLILVLVSPVFSFYNKSNVVNLTDENFDDLVINGNEIWIVEFYAPWCGHCKEMAPIYKKAASALKGVVKMGAVHNDMYPYLGKRYKVEGFPSIFIFGHNKKRPASYHGPRTPQGLVDAGMEAAKIKVDRQLEGKQKKYVVELTDQNFNKKVLGSQDLWLVEFFAPWCKHCQTLAPEWNEAAKILEGQIKFGAIDATANKIKASEYQIGGYPNIKVFPPGPKQYGVATTYKGERKAQAIVDYALDYLVSNLPPPEIKEINQKSTFDEACSKVLCIITILPHILDCQSECRNQYLDILKSVGEDYKKHNWGWLWAEAGAQKDLEAALEMGGFGYPTIAVLNVKKLKFSLLKGSFNKNVISDFLKKLAYGKGISSDPVIGNKIPDIAGTYLWDGKDGAPPVAEEEEEVEEGPEIKEDL